VRIAVCAPQVPFVRGGAEIFAETLVGELRERGHETELVTVPFKWYPGTRVLTQAFLWRLLDLEESDGRPIDLVVGTKFPSYAVRHPNKRVWVLHQFRQAYELDRTELGQFGESAPDRALRRKVQELDRVALGEARRVFATSRNVADRLARATGLEAEVMPHPPQELPYRCESYGDFVLSVNRLDRAKRIDLLLEALVHLRAAGRTMPLTIIGDGAQRARLERCVVELGIAAQVRFLGETPPARIPEAIGDADVFAFPAMGEGFGLVAAEALLCGVPVVATHDGGGVRDIVPETGAGRLVAPDSREIARAIGELVSDPDARRLAAAAGAALRQRLEPAAVAERFEALYRLVASGRTSEARA